MLTCTWRKYSDYSGDSVSGYSDRCGDAVYEWL